MKGLLLLAVLCLGATAFETAFKRSPLDDMPWTQKIAPMKTHSEDMAKAVAAYRHEYANNLHVRDACGDAVMALDTIWQSSVCTMFRTLPENETSTDVQAACDVECAASGGSCDTELLVGIANVRAACADMTAGQKTIVDLVRLTINVACSQDSAGNFCWPAALRYDEAGYNPANYPTDTQMAEACSACLFEIIDKISAIYPWVGRVTANVAELICLKKLPTESAGFCLTEFIAVDAMPETTAAERLAKLERACGTQCYPRAVAKIRQLLNANDPGYALGYELICNRDEQTPAQLCMPQVFESITANNLAPAIGASCGLWLTPCALGTACKDALNAFVTDVGCCAGNLLSATSISEAEATRRGDIIETSCGVTIPPACPGFTTYMREYRIRNLRWAWYLLHQAELDIKIRADIAFAIGVHVSQVTIVIKIDSSGTRSSHDSLTVEVTTADTLYTNDASSFTGSMLYDTNDYVVNSPDNKNGEATNNPDSSIVTNKDPPACATCTGSSSSGSSSEEAKGKTSGAALVVPAAVVLAAALA